MKYDDTVEYRNVLARYHNLTGQRDWSAVEFNPDTASDHFERHGHDTGFQSEEEYKSAAVNFINSPEEKLSFIDADGIKRYFSVDSGYFASVYPDGTVRTFFKPRKGIKYWEGQVNKYDTEG